MKDEHVTELLESGPLSGLSEGELATVRDHAAACPACRRAYLAARAAELMLRERAAATVEPPPFFRTRVLAALRERAAPEPSALGRLWRAAWLQVSAMAAAVVLLGALTLLGPGPESVGETAAEAAETAIFAADEADELTDDQVLSALYEPESEAGRGDEFNR